MEFANVKTTFFFNKHSIVHLQGISQDGMRKL